MAERVHPAHPGARGGVVALTHVARIIDQAKRLEQYVRDLASSSADLLAGQPGPAFAPPAAPAHLTARELEVLRLVAGGADTAAIAEALGISPHTARNHVAAVLSKLGVHTRLEAAAYAVKHHLA